MRSHNDPAADAYAGLNWFSGDAQVQEAVRAETERNAPARRAEAQQETTGPPEGRGTIVVLPDGKKYVQADRQVIFGNDPDSWAGQIEGYINRKIRNGEDVILTADSGDVLKITEDTAGKASFRNYVRDENGTMRRMTDAEYEAKLNAEAHIDELAQISERINKKTRKDETARNGQPIHGELARNGWIYREARFQDFDGTYYQVTISTADGGNGVVVYNVGKMEKKTSPAIKHGSSDSVTETGAQQGKSSSTVTIRQTEGNSQEKSSGKASVEVNPDDTATRRLKERQFELIQNNHPKEDWDYQTWINSVDDVKTYQEAVDDDRAGTPDFDDADIDRALKTGRVRVYSSHRIRIGTFVTPSRMEAETYAGSKNVYSKTVPLTDVAWIDSLQGQFAPTSGEIEARDTAFRRRMSAEERKNTPPKLGDADTVFADGSISALSEERKITPETSEEARYEILKDRTIRPASVEYDKLGDTETAAIYDGLSAAQMTQAKKAIRAIAKKLGLNQVDLKNSRIEFPFRFSNANAGVSAQHQSEYGGSYQDLAKALTCLPTIVENAELIETHTEKKRGTKKENHDLKQVYVLLGAMKDGESIIPIQMEVKEFKNANGGLYMTVAMTKIKESDVVKKLQAGESAAATSLLSDSSISIQDILRNVKAEDGRFLKYAPDAFLNDEQKAAKRRAIQRQTEEYASYKVDENGKASVEVENRDSDNGNADSDNGKREPKYTVIDGGDTAGKESALAEAYDKAVKQGKGVEISEADLKKYQDIREDPEQTLIEAVKKYYEESLKGTSVEVTANDGVVEIRFENDGKKKSVGWRMKADKAATFEKLHQLTENAEYAYSEVNRNKNERTSIPMFHYFVNNAKIAGRDIPVKIQVRDVITRANSKETHYYTHTLEKNMRGNSSPVAGTQGANIDSNAIAPSKTNIRSTAGNSQEKSSGRASTRVESRAEAEWKEAEAYRDAYASIYDFENMSEDEIERLLTEEIAADAYAGLNWFSGDAPVQEAVRAETERNAPARRAEAQQETTGPPEGRAQAFVGYDAETGRGIYRSNFEDNTPKAKKSERVIRLIQDVWSKNPIDLVVENEDGSKSVIKAEFDPRFDEGENTRSDAAKLAAGNRHGTAGEKRVTLNLADDFYRIIQESTYSGSKAETGKKSDTHAGVNMWRYFVNPILYMERSGDETTPYTVSIDVKQKDNGNFVYSFHAERDAKNNGQPAPQTLHAAVNGAESDTANGLPTSSIRSDTGNSQEKSSGRASTEVSGINNRAAAELRREYERRMQEYQKATQRDDQSYPYIAEMKWIQAAERRLAELGDGKRQRPTRLPRRKRSGKEHMNRSRPWENTPSGWYGWSPPLKRRTPL